MPNEGTSYYEFILHSYGVDNIQLSFNHAIIDLYFVSDLIAEHYQDGRY